MSFLTLRGVSFGYPGHAAVFDGLTLHASGPNKSRRILNHTGSLNFFPSGVPSVIS